LGITVPDKHSYPGAGGFVPGGDASLAHVTVVPTIHPSAVLRAEDRDATYDGLVSDLRAAASALGDGNASR